MQMINCTLVNSEALTLCPLSVPLMVRHKNSLQQILSWLPWPLMFMCFPKTKGSSVIWSWSAGKVIPSELAHSFPSLSGYKHWRVSDGLKNPPHTGLAESYQAQEELSSRLSGWNRYWALHTHLYTTVEGGVSVSLKWFVSYPPLQKCGRGCDCKFWSFHPTLLLHQEGWTWMVPFHGVCTNESHGHDHPKHFAFFSFDFSFFLQITCNVKGMPGVQLVSYRCNLLASGGVSRTVHNYVYP